MVQEANRMPCKDMLRQLAYLLSGKEPMVMIPKQPMQLTTMFKANPYPNLPNPLLFKNGKKITNVKQWPMRKTEIREDFDRDIWSCTG